MWIEYDLKPEDWGEFAVYLASQSQSLHRSKLFVQLLGSGSLVVFAVAESKEHGPIWLLGGVLLAVAWWLAVPFMMARSMRRHAMTRERPCLRGRHTLEIVEEGIRATCDVSNSQHQWAGVRNIAETSTHVFVLIGETLGYTVPRAGIVGGDLVGFVKAARAHCNT